MFLATEINNDFTETLAEIASTGTQAVGMVWVGAEVPVNLR